MSEIVHVTGLVELKQALAALPPKIAGKILRRSVAAGAQVIKRAAIDNIAPHSRSGTLARAAIVKFVREESNDTQVFYLVTFRRGKRQQARTTKKGGLTANRDAFYASWVEFGHKSVPRRAANGKGITLRRRGASGGKEVPGIHFLGKAFDDNVHRAIDVIKSTMTTELQQLPEIKG